MECLFADVIKKRIYDLEQMQIKDVLTDLVAQEQTVIDERVANVHKILSAA